MSQSRSVCSTVRALLVATAICVSSAPARSDDGGIPPGATVGVLAFRTAGADDCHAQLVVASRLEQSGFVVRTDIEETDPQQVLEAYPELDLVVTGSVVGGDEPLGAATVYGRDGAPPQRLEVGGSAVCRDLTNEIVRFLGGQHAVGMIVDARRSAAERRLREDPDDYESVFILGLAHRYDGSWSSALDYFERAVALQPTDPRAHYNLALCHKALGDSARWLSHLEESYGLDPNAESAAIGLGNYYLAQEDYDRALGYYTKCLDDSRRSGPLVRWNLSVLHVRRGEPAEAITHLRAIPRSSLFFADAGAWIARLERTLQGDGEEGRANISAWSWSQLPEAYGVVLLVLALGLALAPYLPNKDFGAIKIPAMEKAWAGRLKVAGPVLVALSVAAFLPMLPLGEVRSPVERPVFEQSTDFEDEFGGLAAGR